MVLNGEDSHRAGDRHSKLALAAILAILVSLLGPLAAQFNSSGPALHPIETPKQVIPQTGQLLLREALEYVRVGDVRAKFNVAGNGLTAAVLDTGLNLKHVDFRGAVKVVRNFSKDDDGALDNVTDRSGHGTNVAGIIVANGPQRVDSTKPEAVNLATHPAGMHQGVAIGGSLAVLKVLPNASFGPIEDAMQWVVDNYLCYGISAVNISLQSPQNLQTDQAPEYKRMRDLVATLARLRIPVVAAAGNSYAAANSAQGMAYPAILRETISVAAVYDADIKSPGELPKRYKDWGGLWAIATRVRRGQITPFSQRLTETAGELQTDLVAPGAVIVSSGRDGEYGESVMEGTSQAAPIVTGIILLMQEWYRDFHVEADAGTDRSKAAALRASAIRNVNYRPPVNKLLEWLRTGERITDDYGDDDNVEHTKGKFWRVDALTALDAMSHELKNR